LSTSGARMVGSGDADIVNDATSGTAGTFTIQGDAGLTFNITYTDGILTRSGGGGIPITINNFTDTTTGLTLTGGPDAFSVGATLTLTGSHPSGDYSTANLGGSPYTITVNYN